jgi:hypothetical protein
MCVWSRTTVIMITTSLFRTQDKQLSVYVQAIFTLKSRLFRGF